MGVSNNPDGTARVSDEKILERLETLHEDHPEKLAFAASDVAEGLPIKRQAAGKRLDKLTKSGDDVKRFKISGSWGYYLPGYNAFTDTPQASTTPHTAVAWYSRFIDRLAGLVLQIPKVTIKKLTK